MPTPEQVAELYGGDAITRPPTEEDCAAKKRRFAAIAAELRSSGTAAGRMLEIGCNAGYALEAFKEQGWDVTGCEHNGSTADYARRRVGSRIVRSLAELDPDVCFDLILLSHVLENIIEPVPFLKELTGRLRPGGAPYLLVPNYGSLFVRHLYRNNWSGYLPLQHVWYFDPHSIRRLLAMSGFRLVRMRTDGLMQFRGRTPVISLLKFPLAVLQRLMPLQGDELAAVFEGAGLGRPLRLTLRFMTVVLWRARDRRS
jgi:SAM-dependent methyltransferase